jgi:hypothetical protein
MRKIFKFKLIKRLGFDPLFFFSRQALNRNKKKIPFFGYKFLFRRIFGLPGHKRRIFFSVFKNFGRFKPRVLYYRRFSRRGHATKFLRIVLSIQAMRNFYYFKRLRTLKRFFRFSKFRKYSLRGYSIFSHKNRSRFKRFYIPVRNHSLPLSKPSSKHVAKSFNKISIDRKINHPSPRRYSKKVLRSYFARASVWGRKIHFLEFRLFSVLLRSGFYLTPNSLLRALKSGQKVFLNGKPVSSPNIVLSQWDCVTFSETEASEIKIRLARLLRGVFNPRFYKPFKKNVNNVASNKYVFFERFYHSRYCRRFPFYTLHLSSRHFLVSYSYPMVFVFSKVVNSLSISYPFPKSIARPSSYFFTK